MIRGAAPLRFALLGLVVLAAPARAGDRAVVKSAASQFALELPAGFAELALPAGVLVARKSDAGLTVTVSRVDHPNRDAWRGRDRFFAQVERGVADASPGYRLLRSKRQRLGRVPALDLSFRRDGAAGPERVAMRFLFFRRYSVILCVAGPERVHRRARAAVRAIVASFQPHFAPD